MEGSYQHGIFASSRSEAVTEAGSQLFSQAVSQHEYQPLPHQLSNFAQPFSESSPMQFKPLHSHQEQVHRVFQPSQQPSFTPFQEQRQIQQNPDAFDLHRLLGIENQGHHLHESTSKTGQTWTYVLPQNDESGQQKPPELPRRLLPNVPSASVDSTPRTGTVHSEDWTSQAYRELQSVRERHLADLSKIYMKICYSCLQPSSTEQAAKLEHNKSSIERMVQFLNTPATDIVHVNKDKFYYSLYTIIKYVHMYKSRGSVPVLVHARSLSQLPLLQQWLDSKLQSQAVNPVSSVSTGSPQFQVQEGRTNLQINKTELDRNMTVAGVDVRNVSSSSRIGSSGPSPLNTLQQTNFSPTTVPPNSATSSSKFKRQDNNSMRHTQPFKQPTNQPLTEERKNHLLIQRVKEINEKQQLEYTPRSLFPSPWFKVSSREIPPFSLGHKYPKQMSCPDSKESPSKSVTSPFFIASPSSPAISTSPPVCLEKFSSPISSITVRDSTRHSKTLVKGAEDSQPLLRNSTKHPRTLVKNAEDPQLLLGESSGCSQRYVGVTLASIENQLLALGAPEKSALLSPVDHTFPNENQRTNDKQLLALGAPEKSASLSYVDLTFPNENQRTSDKDLSTKSLNEMVESMSPKALIASVQDIMSVFTLIDTLSGKMVTSESSKIICEDLAADMVHNSRSFLCRNTTLNMLKRNISTSASYSSSSFNEKDIDEYVSWPSLNWELSATARSKRQKIDGPFNKTVLEEIKQTNQSLIETVVDVASGFKEDVDSGFHVDAIVRCSYSAAGLDFNFNQKNTQFTKLPILLVELLLPEDYPKSSPRVLNTSSLACSESEDILERAKLMFSLSLRKLSEPFSLRDMAREWDRCARSVLSEFAQSCGGGSFSSKYGSWESCTTAA